jgi:hypothetical protein
MTDIERRDAKLLAKAGRYYFTRRICSILAFLTIFVTIGAVFGYKGPFDILRIARAGIILTFFWLFWVNSAILRIQHIESIRYYTKSDR